MLVRYAKRHPRTYHGGATTSHSADPGGGGGGGGNSGGGTGRLARGRSHGTVRRRLGGVGGGGSIASAFLFIAALEHAILHWSVRKQPQRIEFEIKCS